MNTLLAAITPDTELILPLSIVAVLISGLIATTWRLANFARDLRDELRSTWSFRDQELWALQFERENRRLGYSVFVPSVVRNPEREKSDKSS